MHLLVDQLDLGSWLQENQLIVLLVACLIGLIPESGQHLRYTVIRYREKQLNYDGSVMLFRKYCDYMIYVESNREEDSKELISALRQKVSQTRNEWGIKANCYRVWSPRTTPIEQTMTRLFSLQLQDAESCKTSGNTEDGQES